MAATLQGVPIGSLVHRFITSGKPGKCELCPNVVEKLEAHHVCYSPEKTIKLCHDCHHKTHFWPTRLTEEQRYKLLKLKFSEKDSQNLSKNKSLGIQTLAKLIAPSKSAFIQKSQKLEIKRIKRSESDRKQLKIINIREKEIKKVHEKKHEPKTPKSI